MDAQIERILADGYLGDVSVPSTDQIRVLRDECREVETKLSFLRRLVQGRHDIVTGELGRRQRGGERGDLGELVDQLPEILSDRIHAPGTGRLPTTLEPGDVQGRLVDRLAAIIDEHGLSNLGALDDAELTAMATELEALESEVSDLRRALFDRIDALQAEMTRRYRDGEARVDDVLQRADPR
ncbi:MAG: aerial mycelium formation protein [Acidimicrobiales bacterium]|nr:aerial mycelium formation protein [Acidimicrobiales bacterium]